jgi:hypothetical protein
VLALVVTFAAGCSGDDDPEPDADASSSSPTSTAADPSQISVAGEYPTEVTLDESSCPDIEVAPMTTTVEQEPGDPRLTLTHAGITYTGSLSDNGSFSTSDKSVSAGGQRHTLSIVGRFSSVGFTARVRAQVARDEAPKQCAYVVTWVGTKDGDPNTVPED